MDAFLDHLDRNGNTIKSYTLRGVYPINIAGIPLDYEEAGAIEQFEVSLEYQFFDARTTT